MNRDADAARAFQQRGRESSARSLQASRHRQPARKRRPVSSASPAQRRAVSGECCVYCKRDTFDLPIHPAHLTARSKGGCDSALCVIPLCAECHRSFDDGHLDLLARLADGWPQCFYREQVKHMLDHADPVSMVERLANDRIGWRSAL